MLFLWRMFRQRSGSISLLLKKYVKTVFFPRVRSLFISVWKALIDCWMQMQRLQSFNSNQCKNNLWSYLFSFVLQRWCSAIYIHNRMGHLLFCFSFKKEPHGAPPCCESRRRKNGAFKASVRCVPALVAFRPAQIRKSVCIPTEWHSCSCENQRGVTCFALSLEINHALWKWKLQTRSGGLMRRAVPFFPVCVELKADLSCTWRQ